MDESLQLVAKLKFSDEKSFEKIGIYYDYQEDIWAVIGKTSQGCFLDYHHSFNKTDFINFINQLNVKYGYYEFLLI